MTNIDGDCEFIYEDLEDEDIFSLNSLNDAKTKNSCKTEYASLVAKNEELNETVNKLQKENELLKCRISELYKTAKNEIDRKDKRIKQLIDIEKEYEKLKYRTPYTWDRFRIDNLSKDSYRPSSSSVKNSSTCADPQKSVNIDLTVETDINSTKNPLYKDNHEKRRSYKESTRNCDEIIVTEEKPRDISEKNKTNHHISTKSCQPHSSESFSTSTSRIATSSRKRHADPYDEKQDKDKKHYKSKDDIGSYHNEEAKRRCIKPCSVDDNGFRIREKISYDEYQSRHNGRSSSSRSHEKHRHQSKESRRHKDESHRQKTDNVESIDCNSKNRSGPVAESINTSKNNNRKSVSMNETSVVKEMDFRLKLQRKKDKEHKTDSKDKSKVEQTSKKSVDKNKTNDIKLNSTKDLKSVSFDIKNDENVVIICGSSEESDLDSGKRLSGAQQQVTTETSNLPVDAPGNSKNEENPPIELDENKTLSDVVTTEIVAEETDKSEKIKQDGNLENKDEQSTPTVESIKSDISTNDAVTSNVNEEQIVPPPIVKDLASNRNEKIKILSVITLKENIILPPIELVNQNPDIIVTDFENPVPLTKEELANISGLSILNDAQQTLYGDQIQTFLDKEITHNKETAFPNTVFESNKIDETKAVAVSELCKNEIVNAVLSISEEPTEPDFMSEYIIMNSTCKDIDNVKEKPKKSPKVPKETVTTNLKDEDVEKSSMDSWKIKLSEKSKKRNRTNENKSPKKMKATILLSESEVQKQHEKYAENKHKVTKEKERGKYQRKGTKSEKKSSLPKGKDKNENVTSKLDGNLEENTKEVDSKNNQPISSESTKSKASNKKEKPNESTTNSSDNQRVLRSKRAAIYSQIKDNISPTKRKKENAAVPADRISKKFETPKHSKTVRTPKKSAERNKRQTARKTKEKKMENESASTNKIVQNEQIIPKMKAINEMKEVQKDIAKSQPNLDGSWNEDFCTIIDPLVLSEKSSDMNSDQSTAGSDRSTGNKKFKQKSNESTKKLETLKSSDKSLNISGDSLDFSNFLDKAKTVCISTSNGEITKNSSPNKDKEDMNQLELSINSSYTNLDDRKRLFAKLSQCDTSKLKSEVVVGVPLRRDPNRRPVIMFID